MICKMRGILLCIVLVSCIPCVFANTFVEAADLRPETVKAWQQYVGAEEWRMQTELASSGRFLSLDFQTKQESAKERKELLAGNILVQRVELENEQGGKIPVPNGAIHHWRGSVFIPGVSLDAVLLRIENPDLEKSRQEDVLESRVLEKRPEEIKLYLRLQRSRIVTAVYDTEHLIRIKRYGRGMASSSSIATRIVELERLKGKWDVEKPEGKDRGFLWRMNSYWRYQQVASGVIVECESMTLSRSIPFMLATIARPIINSIARESMHRTLQSFRERMVQGKKSLEVPGSVEIAVGRSRE